MFYDKRFDKQSVIYTETNGNVYLDYSIVYRYGD